MPNTMSQNFMIVTVRRRAQWFFQALELGRSGVHTGIDGGLPSIAKSEHHE
jgi:hypothetical protein